MRRTLAITGVAALVATVAALTASAAPSTTTFPEVIALPNGWLPEGIAVGKGSTFYSGSRADGAIYGGVLGPGEGSIFAPGVPGRVAVGLKVDQRGRYLFVAGGPTGQAYVFDADSGALVANYALTRTRHLRQRRDRDSRTRRTSRTPARPVLYRLSSRSGWPR